jgi:hypothetical protein
MSEIKHTFGEWEVDASGYRAPGGGLCVMAGDLCIAVVAGDSDKPQAANARLIAAAPELFDACRELVEACDHGSQVELMALIGMACEVAREAIAKATGSKA